MDQTSTPAQTTADPSGIFQREYSLGEILTEAWRIFSKNFLAIAIIVLIVYIPLNLLNMFIPSYLPDAANVHSFSDLLKNISWLNLIVSGIILSLISVLVPLAIALLVKTRLSGQPMDYKQALKQSIPRWLPGILTNFIMGLLLFVLFLLLIIPGVIFGIFWIFAIYAVALNNKTGWAALTYSKSVVSGYWLRVFGYTIVFGLITAFTEWLIGLPFLTMGTAGVVISMTVNNLIFSFFTVAMVVFYLNLESIKKLSAPSDTK